MCSQITGGASQDVSSTNVPGTCCFIYNHTSSTVVSIAFHLLSVTYNQFNSSLFYMTFTFEDVFFNSVLNIGSETAERLDCGTLSNIVGPLN